jgi:tetratricopeptide (TPR) repeat protein
MITHPLSPRGWLAALALGACFAACSRAPAASDHMERGDSALAEGRYAAALSAYTHARELAPTDPNVQHAMMRARVHLIAEDGNRLASDAFEDARYEAKLLLDTDGTRAPVYLTALGNVLLRQGDAEAAKQRYAEALKLDPASVVAHTALAMAYMMKKEDAAKAKAELEAALKIRPDHARALSALGQLKLAEGDLPGAIDRLEAALRQGDDFAVRMAIGNARVQQRRPADAVEHFLRAAQLDPKSADAFSALGQAQLNAGRPEEAERALRAAISLRQDAGTMTALGFALARQKKHDAALMLFRRILADDPTSPTALFGAAASSDELGLKDQAREQYQRLLSLSGGADRETLAELQKDAQARLSALPAAASASASAVPPPVPRPAPRP